MKVLRSRSLLALYLAAGLGAISWWQWWALPGAQVTQKQYDRIRLGMTPAEIALSAGGPPADYDFVRRIGTDGLWDTVTAEGDVPPVKIDRAEKWLGESVTIRVYYCDGKAIAKQMQVRVPPWKLKARAWIMWLRGLVKW